MLMRKLRLRSYSANRQQRQVGAHVPYCTEGGHCPVFSPSQSWAKASHHPSLLVLPRSECVRMLRAWGPSGLGRGLTPV